MKNATMTIVMVVVVIITCLSGSFNVNAAETIYNISENRSNVVAVEEVKVDVNDENAFYDVNGDDYIDPSDVDKMREILLREENSGYHVKDLVCLERFLREEALKKEISVPEFGIKASALNPNNKLDCDSVLDIIENGTVSVKEKNKGWVVSSKSKERLGFLFFDELSTMNGEDDIFASFEFDGREYYVWIGENQFHLSRNLTSPIVCYKASELLATDENIDIIKKAVENADRITVDSNESGIRVTCVGRDNSGITELIFEYWTQIGEEGKYIYLPPEEAIMPFEVKAPEEGLWPMFEVDGQKYVIWFDYNASQFYLTKFH